MSYNRKRDSDPGFLLAPGIDDGKPGRLEDGAGDDEIVGALSLSNSLLFNSTQEQLFP